MILKKKALLGVITAALLTVSASAAFENTNTYTEGQFKDVSSADWFANDVKSVSQLGLMNGVGENAFLPQGNVTVAEAVTMAARANAAYTGKTIADTASANWYDKYVSYAVSEGIVEKDYFDSYDRAAKRYEVAKLFANAMPDGYFTAVNQVKDIHDVPDSREYKDELLTLYNAGVVMGSDIYGTFNPEYSITRAEAAAIINRVAIPENRLTKSLDVISEDDAFTLCNNTTMTLSENKTLNGINSGWLLDNRGGVPRKDIGSDYTNTTDISTTAGTALIREFNKTSTGKICLYSEISVVNPDGFYIEYRNDKDESIFRMEIIDGKWNVLLEDGSFKPVYEISAGESKFILDVVTDLDNKKGTIVINNKECGTYKLPVDGKDVNIYNFRYATTDESTASYGHQITNITSNYAVNEGFSRTNRNEVPRGWVADDGVGATGELQREHLSVPGNKSAAVSFDPISGLPIAEFNFILPENESFEYVLKSGNIVVARFNADENGFYLNGNTVYDEQYKNLWYRVRLELNTDTQKVFIRVNGRDRGTYDFANAATSVNNFSIKNFSQTAIGFDNFKVFKYIEHEDYVPVPVVPEGADDYKIGMNVCSLWSNGSHYGWACITPFDDPQPVLGYYDEGSTETADWEIKYLVEHGIDFQAFCLFFYHAEPFNLSNHLFNGFMNAKYSDMSEFCILLEAANGDSPATVEDWKERWVPYIIENFIKHESYATVDNRPIFSVFGATTVASRLGSDALVKECFDYLEEEVIKLGFDGMVYLACGSSSARLQAMGFDGCHAYNWGTAGFNPGTNKDSMVSSGDSGEVYTVPTASVGFNSVPWNGARSPLMTKEDYVITNEWIRDEYLPAYAEQDWQKNFLWLSTWNEYGEGTYIMPSTDEKGFQYIDVIRETYTKEKADDSINTIPTENQKYRINHLYPQYRRLLRPEGYYSVAPNEAASEVLLEVKMTDVPSGNLWSMKNIVKDENGVTAMGTNADPIFSINKFASELDTSKVTHIKFTGRIPKAEQVVIYYATGADSGASESRRIDYFSTTDETVEVYFPVENLNGWGGVLKYLRIDPVAKADLEFTVKSVEFIRDTSVIPKTAKIDGLDAEFTYAPIRGETGEVLIPFDPRSGIDFRLSCFHEWSKDDGVLKLHFEDHDVVYTVGSDKYLLDGEEKSLGFTFSLIDGMPLVPIEKLCEDVGFKFKMGSDKVLHVETNLKPYYDAIEASKTPGKWEFNTPGDTELWASSLMSILANGGYLSCDSRNDVWTLTDYTVTNSKLDPFPADDKVALEMRVRYNHNSTGEQKIKIYFRTDVNNSLSEKNTFWAYLDTNNTNGEWVTIRMEAPETFKGNVTYLRLDPFDAFGHMDVDYIRFLTAEEAGIESAN